MLTATVYRTMNSCQHDLLSKLKPMRLYCNCIVITMLVLLLHNLDACYKKCILAVSTCNMCLVEHEGVMYLICF